MSLLRAAARLGVDGLLRWQGTRVHPGFSTRDRWTVFRRKVEPDVQALARQRLRPGMTAIDIGANIGLVTRELARQVGASGLVVAFEPDPANFEALAANVRGLSQVRAEAAAIGDRAGRLPLYLNPSSSAGNSLVPGCEGAPTIEVDCVPLDTYVEFRGIGRVDWIKLDVEGAELAALRGMEGTLSRHPAAVLVIEFSPENQRSSGVGEGALWEAIRRARPEISVIEERGGLQRVQSLAEVMARLNRHGYVNLACWGHAGSSI